MTYFLVVLFFTLLGVAYVKGYDLVKSRSPEHLVHFYLVMATIRMLLVATVVALYVFFAPNREKPPKQNPSSSLTAKSASAWTSTAPPAK